MLVDAQTMNAPTHNDPSRRDVRKAVLLGGAHGTLALARSLRHAGLAVWLITDVKGCASYSGALRGVRAWGGADDPAALDEIELIARDDALAGAILVPGGDPEVRLVSQAQARLSSTFQVMVPPWEQLRWACDKSLAYRLARSLGLGVPREYGPGSLADGSVAALEFPIVLKPSMRLRRNRFTAERAWRVDDAASLRERYAEACGLVGADQVVAQQLVPGGGDAQVSYAGLWDRGRPLLGLTARRLRQYPVEFAQTSSYVQTADLPDVTEAAETFLREIGHHGLVEIEFKRDERDGVLKLLDVNPRPWNWLGLAAAAGVDFGAAIRDLADGRPVPRTRARPGVAWLFASRDVAAAAASGRLRARSIRDYAASWARVRSFACFTWNDPLPAIMDMPMTLASRRSRKSREREEVTHAAT